MAISGTASVYLPAGNTWASIGTTGAVGWGRSNTSTVPQPNVGTWRFVSPTYWNGSGGDADWATAGNWSNGGPATGQAYSFGALAGSQASATNAVAAAVVPAIRFLGLSDPEYSNAAAYTLTGSSVALKGSIVSRSTNNQTINTDLNISGGGGVVDTGTANITIGGVISGTNAVTKWGAGKLLLTNSSTYTSNVTTIAAGTLQLDFGAGTTASNILPSTTAVTIGSATLLVNSASSGTQAQAIGNLTFAANGTTSAAAAGAAAITLVSNGSGNVALTAGNTWTRNKGTSLNISLGTGSTLTSSPVLSTTSNVLRGSGTTAFAVVSGVGTTDWATVSGGNVVALSGSGAGAYSDDVYTAGVNTNVIDGTVVPASFTTDTLAFRTAQATTLTLTGGNTVALGGLLVGAQVGSNNTVIDNNLAQLTSGSNDLVVHQYSTGTLEIASQLVNNGTNATSLTKTGPGRLTLSNAGNTYTGGNYLLGGTVSVAADLSLGTTASGLIFDGGALKVTGDYVSTARTVSLLDAGGTIDVANTSGSFTVSSAMNGIGMLSPFTKTGPGTLILTGGSSYQGTTTITSGTLQIGSGGAGASIGTGEVINNGTLAFNHSDALLFPNMVSGPGTLTHAGTGTVTLIHANTYAGTTTINGGRLQFGTRGALYNATPSSWTAANITVNSAGTLGLNVGGTGEFTLDDVAAIASIGTPAGGFVSGSSLAIDTTNSPSGTLTIPFSLTNTNNGANSLGLTKVGTGTLLLAAANSYTGTTRVSQGTLTFGVADAISSDSSVVVDGGTLSTTTFDATVPGLTLTSGGVTGTGALTSRSLITANNAVAMTVSAPLAGSVGLTMSGTNTLTLSGANTYTGLTTVSAGALNIQNISALGTTDQGTAVASGAALQLQGGITTLPEALTISGTGVTSTGAIRNISGDNTFAGAVTLAAASRINSDAGTLTLSNPTAITGATFGLTVGGAGNTRINGTIGTTTGTLTKDGAGVLTLAGASTYTGTTTVSAGTLQLAKEVSLYNADSGSWIASNIIVGNGATLALNVGGVGEFTTVDVGLIAALGGAANGFANGSTLALDTTNAGGAFTYANPITNTNVGANNLALNKIGSGTLVLTGANTYKGATTVSNGTLKLDFSASSTAANIINNGGTNSALGLANGLTGGRLVLTGGASVANSQAFNGTTLNVGSSSVELVTNATPQTLLLTLGAITRNAGSVVDFTLPSGTQTTTNAVTTTTANGSGGIIGGWATVGGTDWAAKSTSNNLIVPIGNALTTSVYTTTVPTTGGATTTNYSLVGGTLTGGATALTGNLLANSLRIANASNSQSLDLAGSALTFTSTAGGLLYVGGADNQYSITDSSATKTSYLGAGAANEFIVNTATGTTLGVSAGLIGLNGAGRLTKAGGGQLTIAGTSTYTGNTTIVAGTLQLGNGGSTGKLSASSGLVNNATLAFNRSDMAVSGTDFASVVTGSGNVLQNGSGTVVLSGTNTYTGRTTVANGTLNVTGSIVKNGSTDVFIARDPDGDFSTPGPTLSRAVARGRSYSGFGSRMTDGLLSSADIRAGTNATGTDTGVTMRWRARAANESTSTGTQPPLPGTDPLLSDVLDLTGMVNTGAASGQTNAFALQMSYDPVWLAMPEVDAAAAGLIQLGWLNPTGFDGSQPLWQNAVAGNFGTGTSVFSNVLSSWDAFAAANSINDANVGLFLGSWGVDTGSHVAWAVINHNSDFAVAAVSVPEPATYVLGLFGLLGLYAHCRRRQKTPRTPKP